MNTLKNAGYVYLIKDAVEQSYKIGRTKNLVTRMRSLKTGNPNPIELVSYAVCNDTLKIEKRLHSMFEYRRRKRKEWFDLDLQEIEGLKKLLIQITLDDKHERNIDRYWFSP